jgi:hypothetical protein
MRIASVVPRAAAVAVAIMALSAGAVPAQGRGGWDALGNGGLAGTRSLNGTVRALHADGPGLLYVGGSFTDAGGNPSADYIATWNGFAWGALGGMTSFVQAIAAHDGKVYAGGSFLDAGGNGAADPTAPASSMPAGRSSTWTASRPRTTSPRWMGPAGTRWA